MLIFIICPGCKVTLKVSDEKITHEGKKFKCAKCSAMLLVRKSPIKPKPLIRNKILVAHEDPSVIENLKEMLAAQNYEIVSAADGIEAIAMSLKELPFLLISGFSLPKLNGLDVCKKIKRKAATREMKTILVLSAEDKKRHGISLKSLRSVNDHVEPHEIEKRLMDKIRTLEGVPGEEIAEAPLEPQPLKPAVRKPKADDPVEKAKRLARTIISDIYLYSRSKFEDSIRNDTFHSTFAAELKEGIKLYENRVSAEVRESGDFLNEAINNFIEKKKRELN